MKSTADGDFLCHRSAGLATGRLSPLSAGFRLESVRVAFAHEFMCL
jgi:hypothetical protein